jgi:hypothetical protein
MVDLSAQTKIIDAEIEQVAINLDTAIEVFERIINKISTTSRAAGIVDLEKMPEDFFSLDGIASAMKKMRSFTKISILEMSDIELSAVVRFVFEMSLWVTYLAGAENNGRNYFAHVALENLRHLEKEIKQMEYELIGLRAAKAREDQKMREAEEEEFSAGRQLNSEEAIKKVWKENEENAAAKFSIYGDLARDGNFGTTADYVETEVLPDLRKKLLAVEGRIALLETDGGKIKKLNVKELANLANMKQEYEWLFSHTSRKLHAEPFSISSDFSSVSEHEKFIYVQYMLRKVKEMLVTSFEVFKNRPEFNSIRR